MKKIKMLLTCILPILTAALLSGCAAGSATAGYALKAQSADSLTTQAEQKIINRAKAEMMMDMQMTQSCQTPVQYVVPAN